MNGLNKIILNNLKMNKKRTLVIIIGVILTSTLLIAIGLAASTIRQSDIDNVISAMGNHHVVFEDLPYSSFEILSNNKDIGEISAIQTKEKIYFEQLDFMFNFYLSIITSKVDYAYYIELISGDYPTNSNEIIVSTLFSQSGNYNIGDYVKEYKIVGVWSSSKLHNSEYAPIDIFIYTPYAYTYGDLEGYKDTTFYVKYKSIIGGYNKIYETAESLELDYEYDHYNDKKYDNTIINNGFLQASGQYPNSKQQISIYLYLILFLIVMSLFCIFVIYNSFAISLSERKKQMGILRSLGATKKQLFKTVIIEVTYIGIISIPIGILLGFGLTSSIIAILNQMLSTQLVSPLKLSIYPSFIIISILFIIITLFISALVPAKKASEVSPMDAIRKNNDFDIEKSKENYNIIKRLFGSEGEIAYKNIKRNGSKFSATIFTLCISIILFITFSTFINHLIEVNRYELNATFDISFYIDKSENEKEIINDILSIDYVDESVIYKYASVNFKNSTMFTNDYQKYNQDQPYYYLSIIGMDINNYEKYRKQLGLNDDTKMILYNVTNHYDIDINERTSYEVFDKDVTEIELCDVMITYDEYTDKSKYDLNECYLTFDNLYVTNINYIEMFDWATIVVSMEEYERLVTDYFGKYSSNFQSVSTTYEDFLNQINLGINSKKFKQFDEVIYDILNKYTNTFIQYNHSALDEYDEYMNYVAVKFVLYTIIVFITIISLTSIFNTINTNMQLRETEFSVLRSIGLSQKGLNKMIRLESFFLGFKTLLYGIPISLAIIFFQIILSKSLSSDNKVSVPFPTVYIIISMVGILVIIFLIMWYSSRKIKNKNIIDSIRNENI